MNPGQTLVFRSAISDRQTGKVSRETDRLVARMSLGQGFEYQPETCGLRSWTTERKAKSNTAHLRSLESASSRQTDYSAALKDLEGRLEKLTAQLKDKETDMYDSDSEELQRINSLLRVKTAETIDHCALLAVSAIQAALETIQAKAPLHMKAEIQSYGVFVTSSVQGNPVLASLLAQRSISTAHFAETIKSNDYASALTITLKLLSDLIVLERTPDQPQNSVFSVETIKPQTSTLVPGQVKKNDYKKMLADSEKLLATISAHGERINCLNKQISDTMTSSYALLSRDKSALSQPVQPRKSHKRRATVTHT